MDNNVQALIMSEYNAAVEKFGLTHNSHHEAYAVILEEYEETIEEIHHVATEMQTLWTLVRDKHASPADIKSCLVRLEGYSREGIKEFAQLAAMTIKAQATCEGV